MVEVSSLHPLLTWFAQAKTYVPLGTFPIHSNEPTLEYRTPSRQLDFYSVNASAS